MEKQCINLCLNQKGEVISFDGARSLCAHINLTRLDFQSPCCPESFQSANFYTLLQSYEKIEVSTVIDQQVWSGSVKLMHSQLLGESDSVFISLDKSVDSFNSSVKNKCANEQLLQLASLSPSLIYYMRFDDPSLNQSVDNHPIDDQSILAQSLLDEQTADQQIEMVAVSPSIERLVGYTPDEVIHSLAWWTKQIHPQDIVKFNQHLQDYLAGDTAAVFECEYRFRNRQGDYVWLADRSRIMRNEGDSKSVILVGTIIDISNVMQLYNQLKSLMAVAPGMLYQYERHADGRAFFSYISPQIQSLFGLIPGDVVRDATLLFDSIHPADRRRMYHSVLKAEKSKIEWKCEFRVLNQGEVRWLFGHSVLVRDSRDHQLWSGLIIDISDKKSLEFKLKRESTTDPLTGVFNRRYFMNMLANAFDTCIKNQVDMSILAIDFDLFKQVNDQYGHDVGDEVLKQVAAGMRDHIRRTDTLARVGGEEFSVILPETNHDDARHIGEKLRHYVEQMQIHYQNFEIQITITVGVASTNGNLTQRELLISADRALYRGKSSGRNCVI